jgi:DNA-binding response OmpR family regulator
MIGHGGKTLLIIDDDRFFCDTVIAFFKDSAFSTVARHTGRDGLDWCSINRTDVILLDQKLPDSEGLQLCTAILESCEQAKIIFITAYPSFDHVVQALRNGANDYLSKPMELLELQLAVDRAFRTLALEQAEQLQKLYVQRESQQNKLIGCHGGLRAIIHLVELAAANLLMSKIKLESVIHQVAESFRQKHLSARNNPENPVYTRILRVVRPMLCAAFDHCLPAPSFIHTPKRLVLLSFNTVNGA